MSKLNSQPRLTFVAYFVALALISSLQTANGYYVQISPSMQALADQYQQAVQQQQLTRQYTQSQIDYIKSLFQRLTLGTLGEEQREEIEDFFDQYNENVQQQQEQQHEYQQQLVEQQQYEQQTQKYQQPEEDDDDEKQVQSTQQPQYEQQTQTYQQPEEDDDDEKQEQQTQQPQYEQQTLKYQQPEEEDDDEKQEQQTQPPQHEQQTQKYQQPEEEDDSTEDDCGGYKAFPNDPRFYLQFDGVNWLKRPCPMGLGFDVEKCACVIRIPIYVAPSTTSTTTTMRTSTTSTTPSTTTTTRSTTTTTTTPAPTTTRSTTTTSTTTPQPTTTRMTTTGKPSLDLCRDCVMLHGVGYAPYPGQCDAYIQCQYYGDVPSSVDIRYCTGGLRWNQDKLTCDYPENVKCQSAVTKCPNKQAVIGDVQGYLVFNGYSWSQLSCPPNKVYSELACDCIEKGREVYFETCLDKKPIPNDRTGFLQLSASGWIRMPCPRTLGYNAQTCRCTDYLNTDNQYTLCPNLKPIPGDKTGYLQFNGVSWLRMPCPATVGYNPSTCQCSDYLTDDDKSESVDKDDDVCKPELILTFDDNSATDLSHNQFWINNTGVTFRNGQAHFDGSSKLTVPGFSNMDLGDTVFITVKYNQSGYGKQTIVTNGDCGVLQSVGICSDSESVDFFVETGSQQAKVIVPRMVNSWQYVMYSLHKDHLKGHVGTRSSTRDVKGSVARRQRGLVIGGGGECGGFTGVVDEIHVFLCYPGYA